MPPAIYAKAILDYVRIKSGIKLHKKRIEIDDGRLQHQRYELYRGRFLAKRQVGKVSSYSRNGVDAIIVNIDETLLSFAELENIVNHIGEVKLS